MSPVDVLLSELESTRRAIEYLGFGPVPDDVDLGGAANMDEVRARCLAALDRVRPLLRVDAPNPEAAADSVPRCLAVQVGHGIGLANDLSGIAQVVGVWVELEDGRRINFALLPDDADVMGAAIVDSAGKARRS